VGTRRLLVVTTVPIDAGLLREEVRRHTDDEEAEVRIVAPVADVSRLEWLATDVDEARREAVEIAEEAKEAVEPDASVEAEVGETDPVQAIEDALREFPADELIFVTRPGTEASFLEEGSAEEASERFGLPVSHLVVG
jgi:hypothetical protein